MWRVGWNNQSEVYKIIYAFYKITDNTPRDHERRYGDDNGRNDTVNGGEWNRYEISLQYMSLQMSLYYQIVFF